jgi:uncharacterized protein DUF5309
MADFSVNPRPFPTTVTGARGPEDVTSARVVVDMKDDILLYLPSATPLLSLTGKMRGKRTTTQYRFDLLYQDEEPRTAQATAATAAGVTTIPVASGQGARLPKFALLLNPRTGETVWVTGSHTGTDSVPVTRGIGSTAVDILAGDTFVFTRTAYEDGSGKGDLISAIESQDFNYTEIVKTPYGVTGRQNNTKLYGGKDLAHLRKIKGIEHAKSLEFQLFHGTRSSFNGTGGHLVTTSGGLDYYIKSNVWNLDGTVPTERAFVEMLEEGMKWGRGGNLDGSRTKWLLHSSRWATEINSWGNDRIRITPKEKVLGLDVKEFLSPHGRVMLVVDPILDYYFPDRAYLLDLNHVRPAVFQGRDTKIMRDIQDNDVDGTEELILTDSGVEVELEASHVLIKGLSV